jgi:hypothetical protein
MVSREILNGQRIIRTGSEVRISIKLLITASASVGRIHGDDKTVGAQGLASVTTEDVALNQNLFQLVKALQLDAMRYTWLSDRLWIAWYRKSS